MRWCPLPLARPVLALAVGLELRTQPVAELRSGLDRERHGRDGRHRDAVVEHQVGHPADQRRGLAGPRTSFHEEVAGGLATDRVAGDLIGERRHWAPSSVSAGFASGSMSAVSDVRAGSQRLRS